MPSTKQDRTADGKLVKGAKLNPTGKGGFQERPQDRSDGRWDKESSISYQYQKLMRLSPKDLATFKPETVAQEIALARIKAAKRQDSGLPDTKEISDRTEGKAPQAIDLTSSDGSMTPTVIIEGVYANKPNFRPDNSAAEADDMAEQSSPVAS